jgi:UDP-N-acetylmuramate--alanine ligase
MSDGAGGAGPQPWEGRRIHLVGVGGAGMSAYARAAHALGASVTGSDADEGPYLEALRADGVLDANVGHAAANLPGDDGVELYYSTAVSPENPERAAARERGIPEWPRARLLGELSGLRRTIAVAGTHGKTTTAAMTVHALRGAGLEPGWLIGATIGGGLPNGHWSEGEWLVVEADESDRSLLELKVELALLTNVELDHHTSFASLADLREVFRRFLEGSGTAVVWDRPELLSLRGEGPVVPYDAREVVLVPGGSRFRWREHDVHLPVPGVHNALDATGALELVRLTGAEEGGAVAALAAFTGAGRRFQLLGESAGGALVYDDYAHHPSEVAATLQGASTLEHRRLVAVFQPHLYSRTRALAGGFGRALAAADVVAVLDVYPARERAADFPQVSGLLVAEAAADAAAGRPVYWLPDRDAAESVLARVLREGDVCVVMGAGDSDRLAARLAGR